MTNALSPSSPSRPWLEALTLGLLTAGVIWLALLWNAIPSTVPLRFNLAAAATQGPKQNLLILPFAAVLLYLLFTYTGRIGVLNLPDAGSPEKNRELARRISVILRLACVALIVLLLVGIVASTGETGRRWGGFLVVLLLNAAVLYVVFRAFERQR